MRKPTYKKGTKVKVKETSKVSSDYWGFEGRIIGHRKNHSCSRSHESGYNPVLKELKPFSVVLFTDSRFEAANKKRGAKSIICDKERGELFTHSQTYKGFVQTRLEAVTDKKFKTKFKIKKYLTA